jgi:hypothetical protein
MKKMIACMNIVVICIFLIPIASPLVYSQDIPTQKIIPIQAVLNSEAGDQKQITYLSVSEAGELRQLLILLDSALTRKDSKEIHRYETILKSKGIIPATYQFETTEPTIEPQFQKLRQHLLPLAEGNISNTLCYLHATGSGTLFFTIGILLMIPTLILLSIFGFNILKILVPLYVLILIATHLIPFRVLLPIGSIILDQGNVTAVGVSGSQHLTVESPSAQVNIVGFTGLTINIPSNNQTDGFLFVSGFSLYASSQGSSGNKTAGILGNSLFSQCMKKYLG